ncbi:condensin complex subunit 1 [Bombina bombina]|uniref:condensin complex subunit 1 n=1 Tax=Bombina bombina TaxID=8345 RepID=UPI00235ACAE4|nr:condensin complex subunit 1 [Bombina bombina]
MSFQFHIPLAFSDLLKSGGIGQYVVQEVLPVKQLRDQLKTFQSSLRALGPQAVLQHFDALYSIIHHFRSLDPALKEDFLEALVKATAQHANELPPLLEDLTLSSAQRSAHLNTLKMNCFLLAQLAEAFEGEMYKAALGCVEPGGKGRKKKAKDEGFVWESEREQVLQTITHLLQLEIRRLWSLSVVEEEFVSLVTGCCYKMMENPSITLAKSKSVRDAIAHLLGVTVKRYNHMLSASVKVIQLLQHFEHLAPVLVQAVSLWATEYGMKAVVGEVMREIGQKCSQDLSRESSGVKALATFLTELSEQIPSVMMPSMSVLLDYLDGESYMMRNAVLTVIGEMVVRVLSGDQLQETEKRARDNFLDSLQEHVHDVNTYVRSCVLQVFNRIVQQKALPLARFQPVVTLVVGRLFDKSVTVCKNAIQLLASFLANNPFTCKLSSADLQEPLRKESEKLKELREKFQEKRSAVVITSEEEWEAMVPEVREALQVLRQESSEEKGHSQVEVDTPEELCAQILLLLRKSSYKKAILLAQKGAKLFQEDAVFTLKENSDDSVLEILERIFTVTLQESTAPSDERPDDAPQDKETESVATSPEASDLGKQEMLVQYLTDAHHFALKIEEAIDVISRMMYEPAVSVVQEVIEFFVTVSQFGVSQALLGVRRMLPLVWSKEPGVREAVIGAYRRLYLSPSRESERSQAQGLICSLSLLMVDSSTALIQCLEEIVSEFVQKGDITPQVLQLLWEKFTLKSPCSPLERQASVMLLGMMSR